MLSIQNKLPMVTAGVHEGKNEINTTLITPIEDKVQVDKPRNSPLRSSFPFKNM